MSELVLGWANYYIQPVNTTATEQAGSNDVTVLKVAIEYNGVTVPSTMKASRSFVVPAGTALMLSDPVPASAFGVSAIPPNSTLYVRPMSDIPDGSSFPYYPTFSEDRGYRFDTAVGGAGDDIDSTGTLTVPTGADGNNIAGFWPIGLFGRFTVPTVSIIAQTDSIGTNQVDANTQGNGGGTWVRRAAWAAGHAIFNMSTSGYASSNWQAAHAKRDALLAAVYFTTAINTLGINDNVNSGSPIAANRAIWQWFKSYGVKKVYQTTMTPSVTSTDKFTTTANQTPASRFTTGSFRDTFNNSYTTDVGSYGLDAVLPVSSYYQDGADGSKIAVRSFSTTLAAAYTAGATTISLTAAPNQDEYLTVSSGGTFDASTPRRVTAVTGTGPYTVTLSGGFTSAHAANDNARAVATTDGIHPVYLPHAAIATGVAATFGSFTP